MADFVREFLSQYGELLAKGVWASLYMTTASTLLAYLFGVPLGVLVTTSAPNSLRPHQGLYRVLGWVVNIGRSIPFIILLVALIPFTRLVVGTSIGTTAAIVPLVIAATPFVVRLVQSSLQEVGPGVIEAAQACGANVWQIISKVLLREALPSIVRGLPITYITLLGYSAMAGAIGAGGLGDIAVRYGYYRYQDDVMFATIIILVVIVVLIQTLGDMASRKIDKR